METTAALDFYTVTYASGDASALGSVPQDRKLYLAGQKATILTPGNLRIPDGAGGETFNFAGWSGSDGKNYTSGQQVTMSGKLVLTAQWTSNGEAEARWTIAGQTGTYYGSLAEVIAVAEATGPAVSITLRKATTLSDFEGTLGVSDKLTFESGADLKLVNTTITNLGTLNNGSATLTSSTGSVLYSKGSIASVEHTATEDGGSIQVWVTFDANGLGYDDFAAKAETLGGRMNSPFTQRVDYGTLITEPDFDPVTDGIQKPTEPGYDFLGWYADEEGTIPWDFDSNTMPAENIMIYGLWEAKDYKVTFDDNGGTGGSQGRELTVTFATSPEAVTVPTRAGYTFMGYFASEDNGVTFGKQYYSYDGKPIGTWDIPGDTTLYAKWMVGEANVFFDMQGHGDEAVAPRIVAEGELIAEPEEPFEDKSIYVFDGWYTDDTFETKWDFANDTVPEGGITLYAKWKSNYADVIFNNNGLGVTPANMLVKIGDPVLFEGAPMSSVEPVLLEEEQGIYSFSGWYTSAACTDDTAWNVAHDPVPESGVKLYAKWEILDQAAPVISGVTDGKTYCGAVTFKVTDDNLKEVAPTRMYQ